jgi:hypothetical protein
MSQPPGLVRQVFLWCAALVVALVSGVIALVTGEPS